MDQNNFVSPENGGWVVYRNGTRIGWFPSQGEAENAFNAAGPAPSTSAPAPNSGGVPNVGTTSPGTGTTTGVYGFNAAQASYEERRADAAVSKALAERRLSIDEASEIWKREYQQASLDYQKGVATGMIGGTPTLEREKYGTDTALKYQEMLNNRRGPDDAFVYASMIRDTPQSIRDVINAAAGRVNLPGLRYPGSPAGSEFGGGRMVYDRTAQVMPDQRPGAPALTAPDQLNPQDYQRAPDYLKKLMWAGYEATGMDKQDAQDRYFRSLPAYSGPRSGRMAA